MTLQADRRRAAEANIGRRCRWQDEGSGMIVDITIRGGWPMYVVDWDDDTPPWWGNIISTGHGPSFVVEAD